MKNYGLGNIVFGFLLMVAIITAYLLFGKGSGIGSVVWFGVAMNLYLLINAPVITINDQRITTFTLNPFTKNIRANTQDVSKALVDLTNLKFRLTLEMNNDTYQSSICTRYYDMKPVYNALKQAGLPIESDGIGAIDWAG